MDDDSIDYKTTNESNQYPDKFLRKELLEKYPVEDIKDIIERYLNKIHNTNVDIESKSLELINKNASWNKINFENIMQKLKVFFTEESVSVDEMDNFFFTEGFIFTYREKLKESYLKSPSNGITSCISYELKKSIEKKLKSDTHFLGKLKFTEDFNPYITAIEAKLILGREKDANATLEFKDKDINKLEIQKTTKVEVKPQDITTEARRRLIDIKGGLKINDFDINMEEDTYIDLIINYYNLKNSSQENKEELEKIRENKQRIYKEILAKNSKLEEVWRNKKSSPPREDSDLGVKTLSERSPKPEVTAAADVRTGDDADAAAAANPAAAAAAVVRTDDDAAAVSAANPDADAVVPTGDPTGDPTADPTKLERTDSTVSITPSDLTVGGDGDEFEEYTIETLGGIMYNTDNVIEIMLNYSINEKNIDINNIENIAGNLLKIMNTTAEKFINSPSNELIEIIGEYQTETLQRYIKRELEILGKDSQKKYNEAFENLYSKNGEKEKEDMEKIEKAITGVKGDLEAVNKTDIENILDTEDITTEMFKQGSVFRGKLNERSTKLYIINDSADEKDKECILYQNFINLCYLLIDNFEVSNMGLGKDNTKAWMNKHLITGRYGIMKSSYERYHKAYIILNKIITKIMNSLYENKLPKQLIQVFDDNHKSQKKFIPYYAIPVKYSYYFFKILKEHTKITGKCSVYFDVLDKRIDKLPPTGGKSMKKRKFLKTKKKSNNKKRKTQKKRPKHSTRKK